MGKSQRDKGARSERQLVKSFTDSGIEARRVPLSGADQNFKGDLYLNPFNPGGVEPDFVLEAKVRGNGFKSLYDWIEGNDFLAVKADRKEWLVCMRLDELKRLLNTGAECLRTK